MPGPRTADAKVCIVDDDRSILDSLRGLLASEKTAAMTFDDPEIANVALCYIAGGLSAAVTDSEWVITS